ncbi:unnamed protein product, partial [marine sediment metagenome]
WPDLCVTDDFDLLTHGAGTQPQGGFAGTRRDVPTPSMK